MNYTKKQFIKDLQNRDTQSIYDAFIEEYKLPHIHIIFVIQEFGDFTDDLYQYYLRKFEVSVLYDNQNKPIKIY